MIIYDIFSRLVNFLIKQVTVQICASCTELILTITTTITPKHNYKGSNFRDWMV